MANSANMRLTGLDEMLAVLRQIPAEFRADILGTAVEAVAKPMAAQAKQFAVVSMRTGALVASIGYVVKKYRESGTAVAVIGPSKSYYAGGAKVKKGDSRQGADRPANYAHLIEFGHATVAPRKGTSLRKKTAKEIGFVAARPFMRPAFMLMRAQAVGLMGGVMAKAIEKSGKKAKRMNRAA